MAAEPFGVAVLQALAGRRRPPRPPRAMSGGAGRALGDALAGRRWAGQPDEATAHRRLALALLRLTLIACVTVVGAAAVAVAIIVSARGLSPVIESLRRPWRPGDFSPLIALLVVVVPRLWRISRHAIAIAHEGGHALTAVMTGRRLSGIKLHSDTSGLIASRGRPRGPGMVIVALAGYATPSLLGLLIAGLVHWETDWIALGLTIAGLLGMLVAIRNPFGVLSIIAAVVLVVIVSSLSESFQLIGASLAAWLLLLGNTRSIWELQVKRRWRQAPRSDVDQLAWLTGVPAWMWLVVLSIGAISSVLIGGYWLLTSTG
jgi:hypothetical protein